MPQVQKFMFSQDFGQARRPGSGRGLADPEAIEAAEQAAYALGLQDGRRQADEDARTRLAASLEHLASLSARIIGELDGETARLEQEAAGLAIAFARKLAGDALGREPLAGLQAAAIDCFRQIIGIPHIAVRVPLDLIDAAKSLVDGLAAERGFSGRVIVLGEPDMAAGDFRLEWADGGMARNGSDINRLIDAALARHTLQT